MLKLRLRKFLRYILRKKIVFLQITKYFRVASCVNKVNVEKWNEETEIGKCSMSSIFNH